MHFVVSKDYFKSAHVRTVPCGNQFEARAHPSSLLMCDGLTSRSQGQRVAYRCACPPCSGVLGRGSPDPGSDSLSRRKCCWGRVHARCMEACTPQLPVLQGFARRMWH